MHETTFQSFILNSFKFKQFLSTTLRLSGRVSGSLRFFLLRQRVQRIFKVHRVDLAIFIGVRWWPDEFNDLVVVQGFPLQQSLGELE